MNQPPLYELGLAVVEAFDKLLNIEQHNEWLKAQDPTSEAERFQLWAQNLGLFQDGHTSLDYRVRDADFVRDRFAELLQELAEHIGELSSILLGEKKPAEQIDLPVDNSSSSGSSSQSSVNTELSSGGYNFRETEFRFQSLTQRLDALYSLAARIRNPKNRPSRTNDHLYKHIPEQDRSEYVHNREEIEINIVSYILRQHILEASSHKETQVLGGLAPNGTAFEDILSQYVSPNCWIVRRAGKANARRKQQLLYWKNHALHLSQVRKKPTKKANPTPIEQNVTLSKDILPSVFNRAQPAVPSLATSASKLPALKPDDLKSAISHESRVSAIISLQNDDLNWPSPPARPGRNRYFECPYCRTLCPVKYLEKGAWETHIIHDLQAYHCTYERCQDQNRLYGSKQEWLDHENQHNRVWVCQEHDEEFETRLHYIDHLKAKHPKFQADRLSEVLISAAVEASEQIHRTCPFCPTAFTEVEEMQQHIAFHLVRLALLSLAPMGTGSLDGTNTESFQSPQSHRPQQRGRAKSIIGDFRLKHGIQRIPCESLLIGRFIFNNKSNNMIVFHKRETSTFCLCFKPSIHDSPQFILDPFLHGLKGTLPGREYIIEYHMSQVQKFYLSEEQVALNIGLMSPPRFFTRDLNSIDKSAKECSDFTLGQEASHSRVHVLRRPNTVSREDLEHLQDWLNAMLVSAHQGLPWDTNPVEWNTALRNLEASTPETNKRDDIYQWITNVSDQNYYSGEDIEQVILAGDVGGMIGEEGLSWESKSQYHAAEDIAMSIYRKSKKETSWDGRITRKVDITNVVGPNLSAFIAKYRNAMAATTDAGQKGLMTRIALIDSGVILEHDKLAFNQPGISRTVPSFSTWCCDKCNADIISPELQKAGNKEMVSYQCSLCAISLDQGQYDLCSKCFEKGSWCENPDHQLHKVRFKYSTRRVVWLDTIPRQHNAQEGDTRGDSPNKDNKSLADKKYGSQIKDQELGMSDESQKEGKLAPGRDKEPASYSAESTRRPDVLGTQIEAGISFQTTDNEAPWWHALDPHGTQMAHIICSIDPLCRLFISRLAEPKRSEAFADSVAKAIHWAVDQNVDIISLGHVVYTEPGSVTAKKIKTAVQRARDHDIVILSSSDQQARGAWDIFRIPHIRHEIFTIAPCNHSGELAKWYKSPWYNYCFVDNVDFDGALFLGSSQVVSGSSVSTAIATGVISLILVFCRLANENNFEPDDKWRTSITKTKLDAMCDGEGTAADDRFVVLDNICGGKKLEDVDFMTEVRNSFRYQRPRPAYSESGEEDDTWNE